MMKLANRVYIVTLVLLTFVFAISAQNVPNNARSERDNRNTAPTVGTGGPVGGPTGLFTVYDGQTLRRGEFTFSVAFSNYDRDPGNADILDVPFSFQVGLTDNFELFLGTDIYRYVKINSPRNLSSFYLPNSRVFVNGAFQSGPAIILAPSGPGNGPFENRAVFRPIGAQPFIQYPFVGGTAGNFGLQFSGPAFGFPAGTNALLGPPTSGGNGADNFPGIGSVYGSILPGFALQTICSSGAATCPQIAQAPSVFTLAPTYLPDAPFINRTFGESNFNNITVGGKWRFTDINSAIGAGVVAYYRYHWDRADDFEGFNQLQRGSGPGGNRGDIGVVLFADARLASWANLSGNIGYNWNSSVKGDFPGGRFTLLDRPDELLSSIGVDFPINKYLQPIFEFRALQYVGGRTPNAFENHPMDALAGFRVFPTRYLGFSFAYRWHANEQDAESFDDDGPLVSNTAFIPCNLSPSTACAPVTRLTTYRGAPPGFQLSENPHGWMIQAFAGRRKPRQGDVINIPANVTALSLSDTEIRLPCPPGTRPRAGTCDDNRTISVTTTAVDPDNDVLTYNYTVSGGRIVGTGATVQWDLSGVSEGTYTITAGVDDGCGICGQTQTQTVRIVACECEQVCACPTLDVSGPAGLTQPGDTMTFTATVSGGTQESVTYNWTVSGGTIESGQGTPSITVRTSRADANRSITATVDIGGVGLCAECPRSDSATGDVAGFPEAVLVDEFGKLRPDDLRARLDAFFIVLQNNPDNQGYIINYGPDRDVTALERLITNHINFRRFDRSRITLVRGGDLGTGVSTRLYRVPPGAENPTP